MQNRKKPYNISIAISLDKRKTKGTRENGRRAPMHEYPITQQIIKIASEHCKQSGGSKVSKINLVIGDYSGYVGSSVQMYFDIIAEGTICEGAQVDIRHIKPKLKCADCGALFEKQLLSFDCPKCGGQGGPTDIGKEFYIESIEIES